MKNKQAHIAAVPMSSTAGPWGWDSPFWGPESQARRGGGQGLQIAVHTLQLAPEPSFPSLPPPASRPNPSHMGHSPLCTLRTAPPNPRTFPGVGFLLKNLQSENCKAYCPGCSGLLVEL